jgi:hypothetical protein
MLYLIVNLYEFGQFLRILLWISLPMAVIAMLVTTYLHYRKKRAPAATITEENEEERAGESWPEDSNSPYQGYLWIKDKYEEYRERSDNRYYQLKEDLGRELARVSDLNATIEYLNTTITDLSARLEANRRLLLNIHNEVNESLKGVSGVPALPAPSAAPPEPSAASPAPSAALPEPAGEGTRIVGWVESVTDLAVE